MKLPKSCFHYHFQSTPMQIAVESDLKFWIEAFESQYIWQFIFALWAKGVFCGKRGNSAGLAPLMRRSWRSSIARAQWNPFAFHSKPFRGNFQGACSCTQARRAVFVLFLLSRGSMAVIFLQKDEEVLILYINQMTWTKTDFQREKKLISLTF